MLGCVTKFLRFLYLHGLFELLLLSVRSVSLFILFCLELVSHNHKANAERHNCKIIISVIFLHIFPNPNLAKASHSEDNLVIIKDEKGRVFVYK